MCILERVMRERERRREGESLILVLYDVFNYLGKFFRVYNNIVLRISFVVIKGGK